MVEARDIESAVSPDGEIGLMDDKESRWRESRWMTKSPEGVAREPDSLADAIENLLIISERIKVLAREPDSLVDAIEIESVVSRDGLMDDKDSRSVLEIQKLVDAYQLVALENLGIISEKITNVAREIRGLMDDKESRSLLEIHKLVDAHEYAVVRNIVIISKKITGVAREIRGLMDLRESRSVLEIISAEDQSVLIKCDAVEQFGAACEPDSLVDARDIEPVVSRDIESVVSRDGVIGLMDDKESRSVLEIHKLVDAHKTAALENLLIDKSTVVIEAPDPAGFSPLHRACARGYIDIVRLLVEKGADVRREIKGRKATPLHIAAEYGREDVLSFLLHSLEFDEQDVCARDHEGDTPLHEAAGNGKVQILHLLWPHFLRYRNSSPHEIPLDLPNSKHLTLLHYAAGKGNLDSVKFLVENGADINACDLEGATPFHFAARCGNKEVLNFLMTHSEDVILSKSHAGLTALHYASWNGHKDAVEWLISKDPSSLNAKDAAKRDTPLHWAARNGSPELVALIVKAGANVFADNEIGELPIDVAHDEGHGSAIAAIYKSLTEMDNESAQEMGVMTVHKDGATLLHYAAGYATQDDIKWLIGKIKGYIASNKDEKEKFFERYVNCLDSTGRNPMHWAAMKGNISVIKALQENKVEWIVEYYEKHPEWQTPLSLALLHGHLSCAEEFLKLPSDLQSLSGWISFSFDKWANTLKETRKGELEEALKDLMNARYPFPGEKLINNPISDLIAKDITPMYIALLARKFDVAHFMKEHGSEDMLNKPGECTERTPLHWATLLNDRETVSKLCRGGHGSDTSKLHTGYLDFGMDLVANTEDKYGKTALQYATELKYRKIEKELMERQDVKSYVDGLYRDRQLYVDAANAILVGAALIASVTFAGWLQPPLGSSKENYPKYLGIRVFWALNSLSFLLSISTVLAGAGAVLPKANIFIGRAVSNIRRRLLLTATLLPFSILFVVGAFIAAGFVALPSSFKHQKNMMATTIAGGIAFSMCLAWFLVPLYSWLPWPKGKETIEWAGITKNADEVYPMPKDTEYKKGTRHSFLPWDDGLDNIKKRS